MCKERKVRSWKILRGDVIQMEEEELYLIWSEWLLSKREEKQDTYNSVKAENFHFSLHQILCMHQISFRPGFYSFHSICKMTWHCWVRSYSSFFPALAFPSSGVLHCPFLMANCHQSQGDCCRRKRAIEFLLLDITGRAERQETLAEKARWSH